MRFLGLFFEIMKNFKVKWTSDSDSATPKICSKHCQIQGVIVWIFFLLSCVIGIYATGKENGYFFFSSTILFIYCIEKFHSCSMRSNYILKYSFYLFP